MMVCHCAAVSDRELVAAIEAGADSVDALSMRCGATSQCGGCRPIVEHLLERIGRRFAGALTS
jgi:bacterioferritin-associated ferredoxin